MDATLPQAADLAVATEELRVATEEIAAQQREVEELLERARGAQEVLRSVMAVVPVAVLITSTSGTVVEANPTAAALLGVPAARLAGKPLQALVGPGARRTARNAVAEALRTGTASVSLAVAPRSGPSVVVEAAVTAVASSGGSSPRDRLTWVLAPAGAPGQGEGPGAAGHGTGEHGAAGHAALLAIAELCQVPSQEAPVEALLRRIAALATRAVPTASWSSVALADPVAPTAVAADGAVAQQLDGLQLRAGEGPARSAWVERTAVASDDLPGDPRWPVLAPLAGRTPVRTVVSVPLEVPGGPAGVLTVYGPTSSGLARPAVVDQVLVYAAAVSAVLADRHRVEELRATAEGLATAMRSRAGIEQAKGIVASWLRCGVDEAFAVLAALSQQRNVKLRDVAALLVADRSDREDLRPLVVEAQRRLREQRASA